MTARETYIRHRRPLFWSVSEERLSEVSDELLVETILNFGSLDDVKELIQLLGIQLVSSVFFKTTTHRVRHNYFPEVANFFHIYFNRHAPGDTV